MSFSFRNVFSPEDDGAGGPRKPAEGANPFAVPTGRSGETPVTRHPARRTQRFLVSELLAFVPPAIAAQSGIPMQKEVDIPLPAHGTDVKLSTLYRICPELFAAEITPLNDSVVTLPPKLGGTPPSVSSPGFQQTSGFLRSNREAAGPSGNMVEGNPFRTRAPEESSSTGKPPTHAVPTPEVAPAAAGLKPSRKESAVETPVQNIRPESTGGGPKTKMPGGFDAPPSGFTPPGSPEPFSKPPASAEPTPSGYSDNPFESDESFATLFSKKADDDSGIPFPSQGMEDEGTWGAMFEPRGEEESEIDTFAYSSVGNMMRQAESTAAQPTEKESAPPEPAIEETPVEEGEFDFSGFLPPETPPGKESPEPQEEIRETPGEPASPSGFVFEGFASIGPLPKKGNPPPLDPAPEAPPEPAAEAAPEPDPEPETAAPADVAPDEMAPVDSVTEASGSDVLPMVDMDKFESVSTETFAPPTETVPDPAPEPAPAKAAESAPREMFEDRDLELKAIFSTNESFDYAKVAGCVVSLPGVNSCAIATPTCLVQAAADEEARIGDDAREMVSSLRSLAKFTGLNDARTFTLHTERGIVSLFLEGDYCLTVQHRQSAFEPGVREKLILIARCLEKLEA